MKLPKNPLFYLGGIFSAVYLVIIMKEFWFVNNNPLHILGILMPGNGYQVFYAILVVYSIYVFIATLIETKFLKK